MTSALERAIDSLYEAFSGHQIHQTMDHCDHCVAKEDIRDLLSKPVRGLTSRDLENYAFKAVTTWGSAEDFKYFLPRLFELMATDADFGVDQEIVLSTLSLANWTT